MRRIIVVLLFCLLPVVTFAHPGNTDSSGCHTCRTNCGSWGLNTGEYHCHNSKGVTQPEEPIKSTYGENGTGYTSPAPEYSNDSADTNKPATNSSTQTIPATTASVEAESTDTGDSVGEAALGALAIIGAGGYIFYRKQKKK